MTMSKEMERLISILRFNKAIIDIYNNKNFILKTNKYDKMIEHYQNELTEIYKRVQELKKEDNQMEDK